MSNKKFYISIFFLTLFSFCFADIVEIQKIKETEKYLKPGALIIFDIDNTLMEPAQELGNDQWFRYQTDKYIKQGVEKHVALWRTVYEWTAIQNLTMMKPAEAETAEYVQELQNRGYDIIGLTTRSLDMYSRTKEQLKSINIDLTVTSPGKDGALFFNEYPNLYYGGILFTANTHKGVSLKMLLEKINYKPSFVIFINDKHNHITPVEEYCAKENIPFIGLRYGHLDHRVKDFNPKIAEIQFEKFGKLISDQEAAKMLEGSK